MNRLLVFICISIALFTGCSNEEIVLEKGNYKVVFNSKDEKYTGFRYYPDGSIKSEEELNSLYEIDGIAKSYYENGSLLLYETFANGRKHGVEVAYFPSGSKKYVGQNESSRQDGVWYWYEDQFGGEDILKGIEYFSSGKIFGSQVRFDSISKMPTVKFYSFDGLLGVLKPLKSNEKKYTFEGELVYCIYNSGNLRVGDTFEISIFVGHLPTYEVQVYIELDNGSLENKVINITKDKIHDFMTKASWSYDVKNKFHGELSIGIKLLEQDEVVYENLLNLPLTVN